MGYTNAQQWALVIVPKVTGLISLAFSGLVIYTVLADKEKRKRTYHRLLLGISCVDMSSSLWLGLSTWPIPEESGIKGAVGNTMTCTVQGFFTQFGIASSFYNASLSVFYLLVIRYGWRDAHINKIEPLLHAIPIIWGLGTAVAGVPLTIFNSANLWCWIAPYQDRGANADIYRWVFFYGPLWTMILVVTINVILVFQHVRQVEKLNRRYTFGAGGHNKHSSTPMNNNGKVQSSEENFETSNAKPCRSSDEYSVVFEDHSPSGDDLEGEEKEETSGNHHHGNDDAVLDTTTDVVVPQELAKEEELTQLSSSTFDGRAKSILRSLSAMSQSGRQGERRRQEKRRSREVANQSLRYAGSFYFTWIALTLTRLLQAINGETYYPLLLIACVTTPLQGLPNFLVYLYPRFLKARKDNPGGGVVVWLKGSIAPDVVDRHTGSSPAAVQRPSNAG